MNAWRRTWLIRLTAVLFLPTILIQAGVVQAGSPRVIEVRIERGKVVAPKGAIRIVDGDVVELRWVSDAAVTLHLHGYDIELRLRPGEPATMSITAHATGRFPITSHGGGKRGRGHHALTYLEVHPR